jgi:adenylate cyclase
LAGQADIENKFTVGRAVLAHEGTLERFTGDAVMIFFNDPMPIPDPAVRAIQMALDMRARLQELCACWCKIGHELDFGIGIAQGYATIGAIGFEGRWDYAAVGTVTNLASRLCGEAEAGKVLVSQRIANAVEPYTELEEVPDLFLKGFSRRVIAYRLGGCETLNQCVLAPKSSLLPHPTTLGHPLRSYARCDHTAPAPRSSSSLAA